MFEGGGLERVGMRKRAPALPGARLSRRLHRSLRRVGQEMTRTDS